MVKEHFNDGVLTLIEPGFIPTLKTILEQYGPDMIIEFGTYHGGLTKYLSGWFPSMPIFTVDLVVRASNELHKELTAKNVTFIYSDLFKDCTPVRLLLALPTKKILIVDNGDKDMELNMYAGYLYPDDMLVVHDWSDEVKQEKCEHMLKEFEPHGMNKLFNEQPGLTDFRFFFRKRRTFNE